MLKTALLYRIEHWDAPGLDEIDRRLQAVPFVECGASQPESVGWVAPRGQDHGALAESVGGQLVLRLATETKAVPGSVVRTQVERQLAKIEKDTGRRPRGKLVKELKEEVVQQLLPRAFPKRSDTVVWIDPRGQWLLVGAGSVKKADAVVSRLVDALAGAGAGAAPGLKLGLVQTTLAPATAMAGWLADKEAPAGFSIDRECELKQPDSDKASVRYARHTLDIDEVGEHVRQGKLPTQLALTWAGRVSFVLTEALTLKKISLLDGVLEGSGVSAAAKRQDDGGFDADVALFTGEMRLLLPDLINALGGLQDRNEAAAAAPAPAVLPAAAPALAPPPAAAGGEHTSVAPWDTAPA